jgi:hypothetical protein
VHSLRHYMTAETDVSLATARLGDGGDKESAITVQGRNPCKTNLVMAVCID